MGAFYVGLDLGQQADYTAIAVLERADQPDQPPFQYHVRHLERPALGTRYPVIVERVTALLAALTPPATPTETNAVPDPPRLILDLTGVGYGISDMFDAAGIAHTPVNLTAGAQVIRDGRRLSLPKRELVCCLTVLFQTGRLQVAKGLGLAETLVNELVNFKMKLDPITAYDSYGVWRSGLHDDLVLAVGLSAYVAENHNPFVPFSFLGPTRDIPDFYSPDATDFGSAWGRVPGWPGRF